ncbi:recombinase family protein [Microbacterium sp. CIAB417]|uniref:recombinase family protein n=1 Tax=Microbacterium sp. CIAB417 TaxID=2860287 RepID=UPI001FAC60C2|nr:recombinase family protein [Microbacterium sp. CIAB417]
MVRFVGLVRVTQVADEVEHQRTTLHSVCAQVFEEEASRRLLIRSRPALQAAVGALEMDDVLVIVRVRHLAQNVVDGWRVLLDLLRQGTPVQVLEGSDAGSYRVESEFNANVREITRMEAKMRSDEIKRGMEAARRRGSVIGRPRVVDEQIRLAILSQRHEGTSLRSIAGSVGVSVGTVHAVIAPGPGI